MKGRRKMKNEKKKKHAMEKPLLFTPKAAQSWQYRAYCTFFDLSMAFDVYLNSDICHLNKRTQIIKVDWRVLKNNKVLASQFPFMISNLV